MFLASNVRNLPFAFYRMHSCFLSRRRTMSFASLGKAAISCRQGLLLTGFAVLFCICTQLRPVAYAQDVPSAPAPQPVPAAPAKPQEIHLQDYSKPSSPFLRFIQPYLPKE